MPVLGQKHKTLSEKQTKIKKGWGHGQEVEHLSSKHKALSSNHQKEKLKMSSLQIDA
jgi:hypothetical protein